MRKIRCSPVFAYLVFSISLTIFISNNGYSQIVINEYSCSNLNGIQDVDSDRNDWIELYNSGGVAVNLNGYYLSDKVANPTKWTFPAVNIPAGGHLLIFASSKDRYQAGELHTNFKLTQAKSEQIVLSDPGGVVLDQLVIEKAQKNHSRGRVTDGDAAWGVFTNPTPDATNSTNSYERYAVLPVLDLAPGFYNGTQTVNITTTESTSEIRYTLDGSEPTTGSTLYTGAINVNNTTVIRAITVSNVASILPSFTETNTYFIDESHNIPVLSIASGDYDNMFADFIGHIVTSFEYFDANNQFQFDLEGDMTGHGNDSWWYDQKGIRFNAKDQLGYGHQIEYPLFREKNRDKYDVVIIKAGGSDNYPGAADQLGLSSCHLRDGFIQSLSQKHKLKVDERSYEPCIIYINGQYWGIYEMRERVDSDFTDHYYDQDEENIDMLEYWGGLRIRYGDDTDWVDLVNYINANDLTIPANYQYVADRLNLKSIIDYYIINTYTVNSDWLNWNTKWWRGNDPSGDKKKWRYTLWDMDNIFDLGQNYTGLPDTDFNTDPCSAEDLFPGDDEVPHSDMFTKLMENEQFHDLYINRYADLLNTMFTCDEMLNHLDSIVNILRPEMQKHVQRWGGTVAGWEANLTYLRSQIEGRCTVVSDLFADCQDVDGPYDLVVNVQAPGTGEVKINTITPDTYPWTGSYFGDVRIELEAKPEPGYRFDHWEFTNHTVDSLDSANIYFNFTQADSVIAYFIALDSVDIVLQVDPVASGQMLVNGNTVTIFPTTIRVLAGDDITLEAINEPGFTFDYWSSIFHTINPHQDSSQVSVSILDSDTITAFFEVIPDSVDLTFTIDPNLSGTLDIQGNNIGTFPWTQRFEVGEQVDLLAIENPGFAFDRWEALLTTLSSTNTAATSFTVGSTDTITAYFIDLPDSVEVTVLVNPNIGGDVDVNGNVPGSYPYTIKVESGTDLDLLAIANTGYLFDRWETQSSTLSSFNDTSITATVTAVDTIIAYFVEIPDSVDITILINRPVAGGLTLDGNPITVPWTGRFESGTTIDLIAIENPGFTFDHWETRHTTTPSNVVKRISIDLLLNDTITAFFVILPDSVDITFTIDPNLSGTLNIQGNNVGAFPWTQRFEVGEQVDLSAMENPGFAFDYWETLSTTLSSTTTDTTSFIVASADTITAYFIDLPDSIEVTIMIDPASSGSVVVDGDTISPAPWTTTVVVGTRLNLSAVPATGYTFYNWETFNNPVFPSDTDLDITFTALLSDTIIAHFVEQVDSVDITFLVAPVNGGGLTVDGSVVTTPLTIRFEVGTVVDLSASADPDFVFDHWETLITFLNPSVTDSVVSFTVATTDTITAIFTELPDSVEITFVIDPTAGGEVQLPNNLISTTFTDTFLEGDTLDLSAIASVGYDFDYWVSNLNVTPSTLDSNISVVLTTSDTIYVYFKVEPDPPVTILFINETGGVITVNGTDVITEWAGIFTLGEVVDIVHAPDFSYVIEEWSYNNPDLDIQTDFEALISSFTVISSDTLVMTWRKVETVLYLPTAFSPNGDQNNDVLYIYGDGIQEVYLAIYNRWGQLVFETEAPKVGWDGVFNGVLQNTGVFVYKLNGKFITGEEIVKSGNITLMR